VSCLRLEASPELRCTNLMCEKVDEACVCRLSRVLERLPGLQSLYLARNRLEELPASLWEATALRHLDLSANRLRQLPGGVRKLVSLETLALQGNPLARQLPPELGGLPALRRLTIDSSAAHLLPFCIDEWRQRGREVRLV